MKSILLTLSFILLFVVYPSPTKKPAFRIVPILPRENGYSNFASVAFTTKEQFESFISKTPAQIGWNNRREFENALREANIDFSREALILLRHTESSGSVAVTFDPPILKDSKLICKIHGKAVVGMATGDMADYCFAVVVSKSAVTQVELQAVEGGFRERPLPSILFTIASKDPSNNSSDQGPYELGCFASGLGRNPTTP